MQYCGISCHIRSSLTVASKDPTASPVMRDHIMPSSRGGEESRVQKPTVGFHVVYKNHVERELVKLLVKLLAI